MGEHRHIKLDFHEQPFNLFRINREANEPFSVRQHFETEFLVSKFSFAYFGLFIKLHP